MQHAQVFTYVVDLPSLTEYNTRFVDPYAETIAGADGLIFKVWMADWEKQAFSSFYLWESKAAMEDFMNSPVIADVASQPFLKELIIKDYPVVTEASRRTRGLRQPA